MRVFLRAREFEKYDCVKLFRSMSECVIHWYMKALYKFIIQTRGRNRKEKKTIKTQCSVTLLNTHEGTPYI